MKNQFVILSLGALLMSSSAYAQQPDRVEVVLTEYPPSLPDGPSPIGHPVYVYSSESDYTMSDSSNSKQKPITDDYLNNQDPFAKMIDQSLNSLQSAPEYLAAVIRIKASVKDCQIGPDLEKTVGWEESSQWELSINVHDRLVLNKDKSGLEPTKESLYGAEIALPVWIVTSSEEPVLTNFSVSLDPLKIKTAEDINHQIISQNEP